MGPARVLQGEHGHSAEDLKTFNAMGTELQQTLERERAVFAQDTKMLRDTIVDFTHAESWTEQVVRSKIRLVYSFYVTVLF